MSQSRFMTHTFHKLWLKVTAIVVGSFGPIFSLATAPATSAPARWTLDLLSWNLDGLHAFTSPTASFLTALTGGFLFGWGMMIWGLSLWVYDLAPEGVRRAVMMGLLCWVVLDSTGSIISGNPTNAIFNLLVLLLAAGPLWRPAAPRDTTHHPL